MKGAITNNMNRRQRQFAVVSLLVGVLATSLPTASAFWSAKTTNATAELEQFAQDLSKSSNGELSGEHPVEYGVDVVSMISLKLSSTLQADSCHLSSLNTIFKRSQL